MLLTRSAEELGIDGSASPIFGRQGGILGTVIVFREVTQQRLHARAQLSRATRSAHGLVNRREFERRLTQTVVSARKYGTQHALCFFDLDQFKAVNNGAGHAAGDELLRQITALLLEGVRERDTVARLGGDGFGLLLANCPPDKVIALTETIIAQIRDHRFVWEGQAFHIGASIGIVPIGAPAPAAPDLMRQADLACYSAKHGGRNRTYLWEEGRAQVGAVLSLEDLRAALHGNLVQIEYQRMALSHSSPAFARALRVVLAPVECGRRTHSAQRLHSGGGALSNHGQDRSLGHPRGLGPRLLAGHDDRLLFINLSATTLADEAWLDFLAEELAQATDSSRQLYFEIKEDVAAQLSGRAARLFDALREMGCRIALDDYGSGALSFSLLKRFAVDYLKMAPAVTAGVVAEGADRAVVAAIKQVAEGHGGLVLREVGESGRRWRCCGNSRRLCAGVCGVALAAAAYGWGRGLLTGGRRVGRTRARQDDPRRVFAQPAGDAFRQELIGSCEEVVGADYFQLAIRRAALVAVSCANALLTARLAAGLARRVGAARGLL